MKHKEGLPGALIKTKNHGILLTLTSKHCYTSYAISTKNVGWYEGPFYVSGVWSSYTVNNSEHLISEWVKEARRFCGQRTPDRKREEEKT